MGAVKKSRWPWVWLVGLAGFMVVGYLLGPTLFPSWRGWDSGATLIALICGILMALAHANEAHRRIDALEETIEQLKRKLGQ